MNTLQSTIDHLVIGANTLEEGRNYVHQMLGIFPEPGGVHKKMGTHNCLLKLGPSVYLEVIAINQDGPKPGRPRWFGLDTFRTSSKPRLITWVVRTNDIQEATTQSKFNSGEIVAMSRGNLEWLISVPVDGGMPLQGIAPALIQWKTNLHPAVSLAESGCTLLRMEGCHPNAEIINEFLFSIGFEGAFRAQKPDEGVMPSLIAYINTPGGIRKLVS